MSETGGGRAARTGESGPDVRSDDVSREAVLARVFVRLADTLASDFDVVDFLHSLAADSVEILGAEAAGVMLADPRGGLRLIASSDERMRLLELFEASRAPRAPAWMRSPPAGRCRRARPTAGPAGRSSRRKRAMRASR